MSDKQISVAAIIDNHNLIITAGKADGVKLNQIVKILDRQGTTIIDPLTKKTLGVYPTPIIKLKVTKIEEAFTICSTYVPKSKDLTDKLKNLEYELFGIIGPKPFNAKQSELISEKYQTRDIRVGDLVELTQEFA